MKTQNINGSKWFNYRFTGSNIKSDFKNFSFVQEIFSKNKSPANGDDFTINKKVLSDDLKMIHEFIEFKYFKRVMKQNKNIFETISD